MCSFVKASRSNENHIQQNSFIQWWWFQNTAPFYIEQRRVGRELKSGETERERGRETKCCWGRVMAWAINLTVGQIFITARKWIILDLIKMNIKIIYKNLDGYYFSRCWTFSSIYQVEWLFTETPFHRSGFSPNVLFTERAAIHLWDCSPNVL